MAAASHSPAFSRRAGVSQAVAREFHAADNAANPSLTGRPRVKPGVVASHDAASTRRSARAVKRENAQFAERKKVVAKMLRRKRRAGY